MFRPSLSDPLRPAATLVTRHRPGHSGDGERFRSPGEFTPIGEGRVTLHSEAIWGVMIALVFIAIFEPDDENKS